MATPAKTVRKSLGKSFRSTLDLPFKLRWPPVPPETAEEVLAELVRALGGVAATNKKQRQRKRRKNEENLAQQIKRQRIDEEGIAAPTETEPAAPQTPETTASSISPEEVAAKRSQMAVGVNEVTRGMEKATLRAAVVCLTGKVPLLHEHLQTLAATRSIPCIAIHRVSDTLAPVLGMKRVAAIGLKKVSIAGEVDYFSKLVDLISRLAPKIHLPWLQATAGSTKSENRESHCLQRDSSEREESVGSIAQGETTCSLETVRDVEKNHQPVVQYMPLAIKKTVITPKKSKQ